MSFTPPSLASYWIIFILLSSISTQSNILDESLLPLSQEGNNNDIMDFNFRFVILLN